CRSTLLVRASVSFARTTTDCIRLHMKSWTLIVSYLWKDTWSRWLEQPSSLFARLFVGSLLVMVATIILVSLHLLERSLRVRLEKFGLNTLIVREVIYPKDP